MKKWWPLQYIHNYRFNSLFIKNFVLIEAVIFLPIMLVCVVCYFYFQDAYLKEIQRSAQGTVHRLQETTDTVLNNIRIVGINLCRDEKLMKFLEYPEDMKYDYEKIQNVAELRGTLAQYTNEYLHSAYVYANKSGYVISASGVKKRELMEDSSWFEYYGTGGKFKGSVEWSRIRKDNDEREKTYPCISVGINLPYHQSPIKTGVLVLNMDNSWLDNLLKVSGDDFFDFYIVDEAGQVVYNRDETRLENPIRGYITMQEARSEVGLDGMLTEDGQYLVNTKSSDNGKWTYLYMTDLSRYNARKDSLGMTVFLISMLLLILSIIVSFLVSVRVFLPVKHIIEMLEDPQQLYEVGDSRNERNELKYIASSFMDSFHKEEQNKKELTRYVTSLKEAQIALLQAQINPHFLFNTLQSINFMAIAYTKNDNELTQAIDKLSIMMRYMMEVDYNVVTVGKELEYSRAYIGLEQIRFGEKLNVIWKIEPGLEEYQIVKVTLQPILENCIRHGFKNMKSAGEITVHGMLEQQEILFEITDNGIGQREDRIDEMNRELEGSQPLMGRRIGIRNVNQRVRMIFGADYGLHIRKEETGFSVVVRLPAIKGERENLHEAGREDNRI